MWSSLLLGGYAVVVALVGEHRVALGAVVGLAGQTVVRAGGAVRAGG